MIALIISIIITGLIIGALARLVIPGRQHMGILLTIGLGIVGAIVGGLIAAAIGAGLIIKVILEIAVAAGLVYLVSGGASRRRTSRL